MANKRVQICYWRSSPLLRPFVVELTPRERDQLRTQAAAEGVTAAHLARKAIRAFLIDPAARGEPSPPLERQAAPVSGR